MSAETSAFWLLLAELKCVSAYPVSQTLANLTSLALF